MTIPGPVRSNGASPLVRRTLIALSGVFLMSRVVVAALFKTDRDSPWSLAATLYSPSLVPALLAISVMHGVFRRGRKELAVTAGLAALLAGTHAALGHAIGYPIVPWIHLCFGLGTASFVVLCALAFRAKGEERRAVLSVLLPALLPPAFASVATFLAGMTAVLHPTVFDPAVFAADRILGVPLTFAIGRVLTNIKLLSALSEIAYLVVPVAMAAVYAARRAKDEGTSDEVVAAFVAVGVLGSLLYHLLPVAGPLSVFGARFPDDAPGTPVGFASQVFRVPQPRDAMPCLTAGWALLSVWYARPLGRAAQIAACVWAALAVLGAVGLGHAYAISLAVTAPLALTIRAASGRFAGTRFGQRVTAIGSILTLTWLVLFRWLPPPQGNEGIIGWAFAIVTIVATFVLERRLAQCENATFPEETPLASAPVAESLGKLEMGTALVFFLSGISGLIYEVCFAKSLALTFGSTATASTTVLATYMGGISLGAWIGGELGERRGDPLKVYALCEIGIALYCAASPLLLAILQRAYVSLATGIDPSAPMLTPLRVALGAIVLLPPTTLMGITMPVLTKQFLGQGKLGSSIGLLYAANTLGAAVGAFMTGYVIVPFYGMTGTLGVAVLANLLVGLFALRLSAAVGPAASEPPRKASIDEGASGGADRSIALAMLAVGGMVTLALETTDIHLLAVVAGNSVYAFSLMLFSFLVGLGAGANVARRLLARTRASLLHLGLSELGLAFAILASVFGWDRISSYFASFATYPIVRTFGSRELVRFVVCCTMLIPPALFIGALFPMAMDVVTRGSKNPIRSAGRASALNTVGNISGAIVGGFLLVPLAGSLHALQLLAATCVALAGLALARVSGAHRRQLVIAGAPVVVLFILQPKSFDYNELAGGANVYFKADRHGDVIAHAESLDGGLTTVHSLLAKDGQRVLTLLTNGKFQGDDGREMPAQYGCALYPLLHTSARSRALVIGLGTGVSAATIHRAGFAQVDVVELSSDIARITDEHFAHVTGAILRQPTVKLHVTDGRNFLLLTPNRYDLITMEISSIWFAGAASLYNREFYQLAKARLTPNGVFQQWIQLHRIGPEDLASVLGTVRSEFPNVWLYFGATQGIIVACTDDCRPNQQMLARLENDPGMAETLASVGGNPARLLGDRLLAPAGVDGFLARALELGVPVSSLVSTDDNLFLEYNTPRGNVRDYELSLNTNIALLRQFTPGALIEGTALREDELSARSSKDATLVRESDR